MSKLNQIIEDEKEKIKNRDIKKELKKLIDENPVFKEEKQEKEKKIDKVELKEDSLFNDTILDEEKEQEKHNQKLLDLKEEFKQSEEIELDHTLIWHKQLNDIANRIRKRVRPKHIADSGNDYRIAITGGTGSGKSWLAVLLGILIDRRFDLVKNIAYYSDSGELISKHNSLNKFQVFVIDEAIVALDKMSFAKKEYRDIVKLYNTERYQNKISIICIPSLDNLGKDIREGEIDLWINIIEAGYATVHIKQRSLRNAVSFTEAWEDFKGFIKRKKTYELIKYEMAAFFEKHNTHLITLEDIPSPEYYPEWYNEYDRLKRISRQIAYTDTKEKPKKDMRFETYKLKEAKRTIDAVDKLKNEGKTQKEACSIIGISVQTYYDRTKYVNRYSLQT